MSPTDDGRALVVSHRARGAVTTRANEATDQEQDLRLRCACGQAYYVYVRPKMAADDSAAQAERT